MPIPVPISAHNAPLPPDALTTIQFNFEWRRLVVELLWQMQSESFWAGTQADIEAAVDKASAMIEDIYTAEAVGGDVNYLGALVGRTTNLVFGTLGTVPGFDDETTKPLHDVSGFWSAGNPGDLIVPVGGAGFYYCYGHVRVGSMLEGVVLRLTDLFLFPFARAQTKVTGTQTLSVSTTVLMADGDKLRLHIKMLSGSRVIQAGPDFPFSATLGMYRVGLAP